MNETNLAIVCSPVLLVKREALYLSVSKSNDKGHLKFYTQILLTVSFLYISVDIICIRGCI